MKLSMPLIYAGNPRETADQVAGLEKAGLDTVWVAEPYGFDSPTLMGYLAAKTETVEIGAGILNIYSRTPGALLQTAAGLDNVSGGRAVIGLGASGPQVIEGFHGVPYDKPLGRTREIVDLLRRGLRREALTSDGIFKIPLPGRPGPRPGQAAQAAQQARAPRDPDLGRRAGREERRRRPPSTPTAGCRSSSTPRRPATSGATPCARGTAKRPGRPRPARDHRRRHGRDRRGPDDQGAARLRCARCTRCTSAAWARAARTSTTTWPASTATRRRPRRSRTSTSTATSATPRPRSPLEWLEAGNLVGPASYVKERIAAFAEAGVTNLQVIPATDDPAATIRQVKEWVS